MATNNLLGTNTEANFKLKNNDTEIEAIGPAATAMLNSYKAIYNQVVKSFDAKTLAANGIDITELSDKISVSEVNKVVQNIIEQRGIKETLGTSSTATNTDFISIMPLNIADADGYYTIGKNGGEYEGETRNIFTEDSTLPQVYHNWLKIEAAKIEDRYNKFGQDPVNKTAMAMAAIQSSIENGGPYAKKLKDYIDGEIKIALDKKKDKSNNNENNGDTILGNLKDGPQAIIKENGDEGIINKNGDKFQSWKSLEEKGILEEIFKKHPHLKEHYNKWKEKQSDTSDTVSNTENNDDSKKITVKGKEIVVPSSNEDKKETISTDTKEESTSSGVGDKPWLFSDGTFNPNFDTSSIDMDKMYTVGTEANDYLKAKNNYEQEERKKKSILNKFFN